MDGLFSFNDPVTFIRDYVVRLPKGGKKGVYKRLAEAAGIFPSYLSQILRGERSLNPDQAMGMAGYLKLSDSETKFLRLLVERERAQTLRLKEHLTRDIDEIRSQQRDLTENLKHGNLELSPDENERFFSSWKYAAARLFVAIPRYSSLKGLAARMGISERELHEIMQFLTQSGLCKVSANGYSVGPAHTHLSTTSPLISRHHSNWRIRAMERHPFLNNSREVSYSAAITLSESDVLIIHGMVVEFLKSIRNISDPSPPEKLFCINLDWIEV